MLKYKEGDKVLLAEFEGIPQQKATILSAEPLTWGNSYVVLVEPEDTSDDGLREVTEDQILGYAV